MNPPPNSAATKSADAATTEAAIPDVAPSDLILEHGDSPAGPIDEATLATLPTPPSIQLHKSIQVLRFTQRQAEFLLTARRKYGDVFRFHGVIPGRPAITSHPDHVKSLFTAKPELAPSLTAESPLRPIVGKDSVLTAQGARHMRQRKLLLPSFHGESIARYVQMIEEAADREISKWPTGKVIELTPRMQAITLDVIMAGIFGIDGAPERGTPEYGLRQATKALTEASTWPIAQVAELSNIGRSEPVGITKAALKLIDRPTYEVIAQRRAKADLDERTDILSMLLQATTEEGESLSDREIRDELLTLVLAGHETTANTLAWAWERLTRNPDAYGVLRAAVRGDHADKADQVEYVLTETMRSRPVVPIVGRRVTVPWQLGEYGVPAGTPIPMSIFLVHHREDIYVDPWQFRPERWVGHKPGTYTWIPFGGGTRRCLGASLAMAEMRVVLEHMARRLDLEPDRPEAERVLHRNVTMIPARGGRVTVTRKD